MATTLAPPINFSLVCPGVYRSGFPTRHNLTFLQRLGLRTIIVLDSTAYQDDVQRWIDVCGITVIRCAIAQSKEPFVVADASEIRRAIRTVLDREMHPILVHSLRGQSRVGVVVGCLRRLQRWSLAGIFEEYRRFAGPAASLLDLQVIELHEADDDHVGGLNMRAETEQVGDETVPGTDDDRGSGSRDMRLGSTRDEAPPAI